MLGAPPPTHIINSGDHNELVQVSDNEPHDVFDVEHLEVTTDDKKTSHIRLYAGMRPEQLRKQVKPQLEIGISKIHLSCSEDNGDEFETLLSKAFPDSKYIRLSTREPGTSTVNGQINITVNEHYFRAVAKIGLHYYLAHNRRNLSGH